jgi:hypothetical protein
MEFHREVLVPEQEAALGQLGSWMSDSQFYLAGGTAVALHLGHRQSVDLDWFTNQGISDPMVLAQRLREAGIPFETSDIARGTLHGSVSGVRVSILEFSYPMLGPLVTWSENGSQLACLDDLACMKLSALAQRGAMKDFLDIYALGLRHRPLSDLLQLYKRKFSVGDLGHLLYSLAYFEEADRERMPRMLWDTNWPQIRKTIQEWVKDIAVG